MICQKCGKREATVHLYNMVNGVATEAYLCPQCASEYNIIKNPFSIENMLNGFAGQAQKSQDRCQNCGMTYQEFRRTGRLGCPQCYHDLYQELSPVISAMQGGTSHHGRGPGVEAADAEKQPACELEQLRQQLEDAIKEEKYEQAAVLRDKIQSLEKQKEE